MGFLKLIGAVSAAEHEKIDAKYKAAIKDLATEIEVREAAQFDLARVRKENGNLVRDYSARGTVISELRNEIAALRPDAEKLRDRAAHELQRRQAKRDAKVIDAAMTGKARKGAGK